MLKKLFEPPMGENAVKNGNVVSCSLLLDNDQRRGGLYRVFNIDNNGSKA